MTKLRRYVVVPGRTRPRAGATLIEVLMSLLIMGLGIASVFTLFPMSILRSVKSTNLTNAALLAETARDFYVFRKDLLSLPPSRSGMPWYDHDKDTFLAAAPAVPDGQIPQPFVGTFVVDPMGGVSASTFGNTPGRFGEALRVANGAHTDLKVMASPDSWVTAYEEIPQNINSTGDELTFPTDADFATFIGAPNTRVLVMSDDLKQSAVTTLDGTTPVPAANRLQLSSPLPTSLFDSGAGVNRVGTVRVQAYERRYTYQFTIHVPEYGPTWGQIVVFFRRDFADPEDSFEARLPPSPNPNRPSSFHRKLIVDMGAGFAGDEPKGGDYVFGTWRAKPGKPVIHGRWYRIVTARERDSPATPGHTEFELILDRGWEGLTHANNEMRIMFPKGVISVFDL